MSPKQTSCNGAPPLVAFLPRLYDAFHNRVADVLTCRQMHRIAMQENRYSVSPGATLFAETTAWIGLKLLFRKARSRFGVPSDCFAQHRALSDKAPAAMSS